MKEQIISLFTAIGRFKVVFGKGILIKPKPTDKSYWIDDMTMVRMQYMVTISNLEDNWKKPLDDLTEYEQKKLLQYLQAYYRHQTRKAV